MTLDEFSDRLIEEADRLFDEGETEAAELLLVRANELLGRLVNRLAEPDA